jgi:hypothetical protein
MEAVKWIGGGVLAVIAYVVISNTLWLLVGSRLLQSLPGVNIKGLRGTLKIAVMLVLTALAIMAWIVKRAAAWLGASGLRRPLSAEVAAWVGVGARWVNGLRKSPERDASPPTERVL